MTTKLYKQDESGIRFVSDRRPGEVRIPNYVYDLWLPLLGATYIGVYSMYCRLERQESVKGLSNQKIARACRVGTTKLGQINNDLEALGFIKLTKPNGQQKLKHFTTQITVCDPPKEVTPEIIAKYGSADSYEPLSTWLLEDTTNSQIGINHGSQFPNGNADNPKQERDAIPNGNAKIESPILQPLVIESNTPLPPRDAFADFVETLPVDDTPEPPTTKPPINDEMAAKLLINAFLTATRSAKVTMLDSRDRKREASILYDDGMRPIHIATFIKRLKADEFWRDRSVSWNYIIDNIVSHFETRPLVTTVFEPEKPIEPLPVPTSAPDPDAQFTEKEFDDLLEATAKAMDF